MSKATRDAGSGAFHRFDPRRAWLRTLSGALAGGAVFALLPERISPSLRGLVAWDVFAIIVVTICAVIIVRSTPAETQRRAQAEDPGRSAVWMLAIVASLFSLFAAIVTLREARVLTAEYRAIWTALTVAAIVLSWVLTHASYTLRYAFLFHDESRNGATPPLDFPGRSGASDPPSDLDFAYFSFTIGMTFQVSDVTIRSSRIRRAVLLHALVSFVYNTTIIALALNLTASIFS